jgi:protein-S-isoprenylcysteine O-methyltransferase Ste14
MAGLTWFDHARHNSKTTSYGMDQRPIIGSMEKLSRAAIISAPSPQALATAWGGAAAFAASLAYFLYAYLVRFGARAADTGIWRPVLTDIALFSAFALHHSLFARTPLKAWMGRVASPLLERSLYTWVASAMFAGVCWWWMPVPGEVYRLESSWRWLGWSVQAAGVLLTFLVSRALDVLDLAGVRPVLTARAAHVPLKTSGLFAIVRHPLYFGWALFTFGAPDMTATRALFAAVSTAYLALAIPWEERALVRTFGSEYEAYRRKTRWRMLPGVY